MTDIEGYIPNWLKRKVKQSVENAIGKNEHLKEYIFWGKNWPLGLLYFEYYYYQEVIIDYIKTHGEWGEEQIKEGRIFKSKEDNA